MRELRLPPEWEIEWFVLNKTYGSVVIRHNRLVESPDFHYFVPPYTEQSLANWNGVFARNWLLQRKSHWDNINCTCGHWNKVPRLVLERFIATVNLLEKE